MTKGNVEGRVDGRRGLIEHEQVGRTYPDPHQSDELSFNTSLGGLCSKVERTSDNRSRARDQIEAGR